MSPSALNTLLNKTKGKLIFSFKGNSTNNFPILAAFIGFLIASLLLTSGDDKYTDLVMNKRELMNKILDTRGEKLQNAVKQLKDTVAKKQTALNDTLNKSKEVIKLALSEHVKILDSLKQIQRKLASTINERNHLNYFNADSLLNYYAKYFSFDQYAFDSRIGVWDKDSLCRIEVLTEDIFPELSDNSFSRKDTLIIKMGKTPLIPFISKYPGIGFWLFMSIAQMTLWFLVIALVIGTGKNVDEIVPIMKYNFRHAFMLSILPLLLVGVFSWVLYWKVIDKNIIEDYFFLGRFNFKMIIYSVPGYITAALCFGCYLFLSNKLELLNFQYKIAKTLERKALYEKQYKKLRSAFDLSFLFSSIILSVFVFWVGLLLSAVNDIEPFKFWSLSTGKPYISYDFVYLVGLIHTVLLLIFYIPARIRFNSLEIKKEEEAAVAVATGPAKKVFTYLWEFLGKLVITTSPLLASFLQKLIDLIR